MMVHGLTGGGEVIAYFLCRFCGPLLTVFVVRHTPFVLAGLLQEAIWAGEGALFYGGLLSSAEAQVLIHPELDRLTRNALTAKVAATRSTSSSLHAYAPRQLGPAAIRAGPTELVDAAPRGSGGDRG